MWTGRTQLLRLNFEETARTQADNVSLRLERSLSRMRAAARHFSSPAWITADDLLGFYDSEQFGNSIIKSFTWTVLVPEGQVASFADHVRRTNHGAYADFAVHMDPDDAPVPGEGYLVVTYALPDARKDLIGAVVGPKSFVLPPLLEVLRTRMPVAAPVRPGPQPDGSGASSFLAFPVFYNAEQSGHIKGFLSMPVLLKSLFAEAVSAQAARQFDMYVVSRGATEEIYDVRRDEVVQALPDDVRRQNLVYSSVLPVGDSDWQLLIVPAGNSYNPFPTGTVLVLLTSIVTGILSAIACSIILRSNQRMKDKIAGQTRELRQYADQVAQELGRVEQAAAENAALADDLYAAREDVERAVSFLSDIMDNVSQGIAVFDGRQRLARWNRQLCPITGLDATRLHVGLSAARFFDMFSALLSPDPDRSAETNSQSFVPDTGEPDKAPVRFDYKMTGDRYLVGLRTTMAEGGFILTFTDITERQNAVNAMRRMAHYDQLTGLRNRARFSELVAQAVADTRKTGKSCALLMIDLDKFKPINDNFGHAVGDALLAIVGSILRHNIRESDVAGRMGGDEFAILFPECDSADIASEVAQRLVVELARKMTVKGHGVQIGASIGLARCPEHAMDPISLLKAADDACYAAKRAGRGRVVVAQRAPACMASDI